jgi:hypothetical protein
MSGAPPDFPGIIGTQSLIGSFDCSIVLSKATDDILDTASSYG